MLERSKGAPLLIELKVTLRTSDHHFGLFEKCLGESHRLASVTLECARGTDSQKTSQFLEQIIILDIPIIDVTIPPYAEDDMPQTYSLGTSQVTVLARAYEFQQVPIEPFLDDIRHP